MAMEACSATKLTFLSRLDFGLIVTVIDIQLFVRDNAGGHSIKN